MVTIKLQIDKKETIFRVPFISGRVMRESYPTRDLVMALGDGGRTADADVIDALAAFVCMAFGGQFTIDQLLDGMCCDHMITTAFDIVTAIHTNAAAALGDFPPTPGGGS